VIVTETVDPISREARTSFSAADLKNRYSNRRKISKDADGNDRSKPLANWWLAHPQRREYEHAVFAPGEEIPNTYNLWRGFAVAPDSVDSGTKCALYLAHIRDNICQSNEALYDYTIKWMASGVQNPGRPGGAALVLRGDQGVGKGQFVQHYAYLFGQNYVQVYKPEQVLNRFNAHLAQAIVLFADEALFAGNPQHEPILKALVTEEEMLIEHKGVDAIRARSCLHTIIATNAEFAVRVSPGDRRFCCMEVGNACKENHPYFHAIKEQMKSGGYKALLGFLLKIDLTDYHPEDFPRTKEHDLQRAQSRYGIDLFIEKICHDGRVPCQSQTHPGLAITSVVILTLVSHGRLY
jgi:Family of unknown function (DUF5906)